MALEIYNTLTRRKEVFTPVTPGHVGLYICGPTVYSDAHVGHAKAYIMGDIVSRYLRFLGYSVTYVQNITDVGHMTDNDDVAGEDKLEKQSRKEKKHPMEIAEFYTRRYYEDMDALNVLRPDIAPRATGHIIEQIELIKKLIEKGFAYESEGNVYFDVSKDHDYGKLSGRKTEDQEASGRVEARTDKRSPNDFALWKRAEAGHILHWPSPWGDGFPGWHIECSAMAMKYLGQTIDIHGAGLENQFPHNECEIAQSESITGQPFVRYWMHNNMVTTGGVKMGKSLGNSAYLRDLYQKYNPLSLRFTILQSHYRGTTEFTEEAIKSASTGYVKLVDTFKKLASFTMDVSRPLTDSEMKHPYMLAFLQAMDADFNTPQALALLQRMSKDTNTMLDAPPEKRNQETLERLYQFWVAIADRVLGILPYGYQNLPRRRDATVQASGVGIAVGTGTTNPSASHTPLKHYVLHAETGRYNITGNDVALQHQRAASETLNNVMQLNINWRKAARDRRDFAMSDTIRKELEEAGIILEDSKEGTTWRMK